MNRQDEIARRLVIREITLREAYELQAALVRDLERQVELAERAVAENRSERWNSIETKHAQRLEGRVRDLEAALRTTRHRLHTVVGDDNDPVTNAILARADAALAPAEEPPLACACVGVQPGQTECPCAIWAREQGHPWPAAPAEER